jgi:hypothetical protein
MEFTLRTMAACFGVLATQMSAIGPMSGLCHLDTFSVLASVLSHYLG